MPDKLLRPYRIEDSDPKFYERRTGTGAAKPISKSQDSE